LEAKMHLRHEIRQPVQRPIPKHLPDTVINGLQSRARGVPEPEHDFGIGVHLDPILHEEAAGPVDDSREALRYLNEEFLAGLALWLTHRG
jgi:hypothetical protein